MSNTLYLISTTFKNDADGEESYGYRIFDDYNRQYFNCWDKPIADDLELLKQAIFDDGQEIDEMITLHSLHGFYINDNWYESEKIKPLVEQWQSERDESEDEKIFFGQVDS